MLFKNGISSTWAGGSAAYKNPKNKMTTESLKQLLGLCEKDKFWG